MSCRHISLHRGQLRKSATLLFVTSMLVATAGVYAQDAIRPSLAGQQAADAREQDVSRIPYNLLLGPVRMRVGATVGVEYNDNINYSDDGSAVVLGPFGPTVISVQPEDDIIVTPNLTLDMIWPVTQLNTLRLDLGIGYAFYLDHSKNDTDYILVAPKSQIAFDIFVGDFRINIHDRMQLQQDPIQEGALSNVVDYGRFENTGGVSVLWDLNKLLFQVGYDHYNFVSTTSAFEYLDRNSDIFQGSAAFIVNPTLTIGAEGNAICTRYDQRIVSDNKEYSVGD